MNDRPLVGPRPQLRDRAAVNVGIAAPASGSIFRIVDFPRIMPEIERLDLNHMQSELAGHAPPRELPARHP